MDQTCPHVFSPDVNVALRRNTCGRHGRNSGPESLGRVSTSSLPVGELLLGSQPCKQQEVCNFSSFGNERVWLIIPGKLGGGHNPRGRGRRNPHLHEHRGEESPRDGNLFRLNTFSASHFCVQAQLVNNAGCQWLHVVVSSRVLLSFGVPQGMSNPCCTSAHRVSLRPLG